MAKEPVNTIDDDEDWETATADIGTEWNFEKDGDLIGTWVGKETIDLPEHSQRVNERTGEIRDKAEIYQFRLDNGEEVFIWASHQIDAAMAKPGLYDRVKIHFKGYKSFTGKQGPQQVKEYEVKFKSAK